jgi:hypothetical protein
MYSKTKFTQEVKRIAADASMKVPAGPWEKLRRQGKEPAVAFAMIVKGAEPDSNKEILKQYDDNVKKLIMNLNRKLLPVAEVVFKQQRKPEVFKGKIYDAGVFEIKLKDNVYLNPTYVSTTSKYAALARKLVKKHFGKGTSFNNTGSTFWVKP